MIEFALAHPWMTFFIVLFAIASVRAVITCFFMAINIANNGWPPPHVSASGELKKKLIDGDD